MSGSTSADRIQYREQGHRPGTRVISGVRQQIDLSRHILGQLLRLEAHLRLNLDQLRLDRAEFVQQLKELNIGTSVHFIPLHLHPYYRETYGYVPSDFPVAFGEFQRAISLPIYSKMRDQDVNDVINAVSYLVEKWRI